MEKQREHTWAAPRLGGENRRRAFTLMDVLVTLLIISILIGLLVPAISKANEVARRMVCQSNVRQLGIGVLMYADANADYLPHSRFVAPLPNEPQEKRADQMIFARLESDIVMGPRWDGLGHLFHQEYLPAPGVFYCPSHSGNHRYDTEFDHWQSDLEAIATNYHYRGEGPVGVGGGLSLIPQPMTRQLFRIDPAQSSLIADAMRSQSDLNHVSGVNFFRADLTVHWYRDEAREISSLLAGQADSTDGASATVSSLWSLLDHAANAGMSAGRR